MTALQRAQIAYLTRHPWQLGLAALGVLIGVAVMVAVDVANQSARKAFLLSMDAITGEATHQVIGGPNGIDANLYRKLRVDHGIRYIAPVIEGDVRIGENSLGILGIDLFAERNMRELTGQLGSADTGISSEDLFRGLLTVPGSVVMTAPTANAYGLVEGDTFDVIALGVERRATVLAVIEDDSASLDRLLFVDIATAEEWLSLTGRLSRTDVRLPDSDEAERRQFNSLLPRNVRLMSAAGRTQTTADLSQAFMTNLTAMSLLALLVGLFLIYNSVSFSVLQRRPLIATLRALGVTRAQVIGLVVSEAAAIGLIAAAIGVAAGIVLGQQLLALVSQSINDLYFRVNVTQVRASTLSVLKGIGAGTAAAIVAALVPAIEASLYEPRLAMRRSSLEARSRSILPLLTALGAAIVVSAVVVLLLSGRSLIAGLSAVFMLILGFALFVPPLVRVFSRLLEPIAKVIGGTIARVAVADISASLSRTGVAIVALAVAVSATVGVQIMVNSFRASVSDWLGQSLQADVYLGVQRGELQSDLVTDLIAVDGVESVSTRKRVWLESEGGRTQLLVTQMAPGGYAGTEILAGDRRTVWSAFETEDAVLVSEPYAYMHGVNPGNSISLLTDDGEREFDIEAIYKSYDINASAVLMSRNTYDRYWDDSGVDALALYLEDGSDVDAVIDALASTADGRQRIDVNSNARIREMSLEIFDRTFRITDVLYWLTLGVAFVGILGAMLALQLERGRELATLRALGMTPMQLGGMITTQTGVIGLFSGLAAIPLGLVMAWVLIEVINRRAFGWQIDMQIVASILVSATGFAVVAALIAGLYPSWRAAQSQPALAMREE